MGLLVVYTVILSMLQGWRVRLVVNNYMEQRTDSNVIGVSYHTFHNINIVFSIIMII